MSIATKRGDAGMTDLMYGRRVSKTDHNVAAYGCIDELNAALGVVRATATQDDIVKKMATIQKTLIVVMGELATHPEDHERYVSDKFSLTDTSHVDVLDQEVSFIENEFDVRFKGWATPGESGNLCSAHLDVARTVCRRAERYVAALFNDQVITNQEVLRYLNRLSDLLWLLGRYNDALCAPVSEDSPAEG